MKAFKLTIQRKDLNIGSMGLKIGTKFWVIKSDFRPVNSHWICALQQFKFVAFNLEHSQLIHLSSKVIVCDTSLFVLVPEAQVIFQKNIGDLQYLTNFRQNFLNVRLMVNMDPHR